MPKKDKDGLVAVIYARYSSENQREESIEGQLRECYEFAKKNDISVVGEYIDRAYSAKTDRRPDFQRMIKDSAKRSFNLVIVWKLDRFARNRYDSAHYKTLLKKNGVKVMSATERISDGAEGILLESVLEGMAEYYSADLAEKVTRGMTENALKCRFNGCGCVPFGYGIDSEHHYQLDPAKAPLALELFSRYADGESTTDIINDLNARGVKTSRGVPLNKNSLRNMLKNRNYVGEYHYMDIVIPGGVPRIVSDELFERANRRMEGNKRVPGRGKAKEKYILTTKLFCGDCLSMMVGESGYKNGVLHRYYKCASAKRHECKKKPIRKDVIEDGIICKTMELLSDDDTMQRIDEDIIKLLNEDSTMIPALEAQRAEVQAAIDNVMKAIEAGVFTKTTKSRLEELEAEETRLTKCIEIEQLKKPTLTARQILLVLDKYKRLDMTVQKNREKLVNDLVGNIILSDDGRVVITFKYSEDPVTTTVAEIEEMSNRLRSDVKGVGSLTLSGEASDSISSCSPFSLES